MGWTNPVTFVVGQLVTAALMNQQIRDNLSAIWQGLAAGDLDYYTGATSKTRIPIGGVGNVLKVVGGVPAWTTNAIGCRISNSGALSVNNDTVTTVTSFATEVYDSDTYHTGTSGTITVPAGLNGIYILNATGYFDGHADTGLRETGILINDVAIAKSSTPAVSGKSTWMTISSIYALSVGMTVKLSVLQISTASLNWNDFNLSIMKVG